MIKRTSFAFHRCFLCSEGREQIIRERETSLYEKGNTRDGRVLERMCSSIDKKIGFNRSKEVLEKHFTFEGI